MKKHSIQLTAAEITVLWTNYVGESMSVCVFNHFLAHIEDAEIKVIIEHAMDLSLQHMAHIKNIFNNEGIALPQGFTKKDVNTKAKRLYSDTFYLNYIKHMAKGGLVTYGSALPNAVRRDIRSYLSKCLQSTIELFNEATELLLQKGIEVRPPFIPYPEETGFVHKKSFLAGWFGEQRPLTGMEITQLYANIQTNKLGESLIMGFSQTAVNDKVREYVLRGKYIAEKHMEIFSSYLRQEDLPAPVTWAAEVTASTEPPFSDKLMMYHTGLLSSTGIGNYGVSASLSPRHDIAANLGRLILEVSKYADDGAKLTIEHGWMERPPSAVDRDHLAE